VPQKQVFTIGYEGTDLLSFLAELDAVGIKQVIDVRELPLSRKRGFSKSALASALSECGINYVHLRDLGDPKPGREAARRGDHIGFQRIYRKHLASPAAQSALSDAIRHASSMRSCLLCFERDFVGCHRAIVADAMAATSSIKVKHLQIVPRVRNAVRGIDERSAVQVW
jgi:uncharacterized protein (DUF488 family)